MSVADTNINKQRLLSSAGFTLLEILIVIIVIAIIVVVGANNQGFQVDAHKYQETVAKLKVIKNALVGDDRLLNEGVRADFGYFGVNGDWPAAENTDEVPTTALAPFLPPMPETAGFDYYKQDAWGNSFIYRTDVASFVEDSDGVPYRALEILSYGQDGSSGTTRTIFDADTHILIRKNIFEDNFVLMSINDCIGTTLRAMPFYQDVAGALTPIDASVQRDVHQIYRVQLLDVAGNVLLDTENMYTGTPNTALMYATSIFSNKFPFDSPVQENLIDSGIYRLRVYPTNGTLGNKRQGKFDHRDDLNESNAFLETVVPVYPKDMASINYLIFKFPGRLDLSEIEQ